MNTFYIFISSKFLLMNTFYVFIVFLKRHKIRWVWWWPSRNHNTWEAEEGRMYI